MEFNIGSRTSKYRGVENVLLDSDFTKNKKRKKYDLEFYFLYIDAIEVLYKDDYKEEYDLFNRIVYLNNILKGKGIDCELAVMDVKPIKNVYGYAVDFLGIDIVFDMAESLLENVENEYIRGFLNENGLCPDTKNIDKIIEVSDTGKYEVFPVYVYSVRI